MGNNPQHIRRSVEKEASAIISKTGVKSLLVAVSGGADSVALLRLCHSIAPHLNLRIEAANCNFHLRGEESDRDSEFTAGLCSSLGITLHRLDYDVDSYVKTHPGASTEMACRELRYADFFRLAGERGLERVAVAHNADDDIETMMLNMLRGSGSRGLRGIDRDNGKVIRPLLSVSRTEIESYLSALGQDYVTDSTNLSCDYRRNFIRHRILPLIEERWQGARKALSRTVSILKEESEIVEEHYRRQIEALGTGSDSLRAYADGVTTGTVLRFIEPYGGNPETASEIFEALRKPYEERRWMLGMTHVAVLERDRLTVCGVNDSGYEEVNLSWTRMEMSENTLREVKGNKDHSIIFLPAGEEEYMLRKPTKGDRIAPLGMKGTRLVSDVISDAKLNTEQKAKTRVLVRRADNEIIWVTGLKRSRHDLIGKDTEAVYKIVCR